MDLLLNNHILMDFKASGYLNIENRIILKMTWSNHMFLIHVFLPCDRTGGQNCERL